MRINELEPVLRSAFGSVQFCRLWSLREAKAIDCGSAEYIVKEHGGRALNRLSAKDSEIVIITD